MRQVLRAGALGKPRGMGWGGRQEGGSGWGTHDFPSLKTVEHKLSMAAKLHNILIFEKTEHYFTWIL